MIGAAAPMANTAYCDGCGRAAKTTRKQVAPRGWSFIKLRFAGDAPSTPDPDIADIVVVCSEECKGKLTWGKQR